MSVRSYGWPGAIQPGGCWPGGVQTPTTPLLVTLQSYWKFDEVAGARFDAHNSNNLTDNNGVTSATGIIDLAAHFAAAGSQYLDHESNASLQAGDTDFTIQAWAYLDSEPGAMVVVSKWGTGTDLEYILFYDADRFNFAVRDVSSGVVVLTANTFGAVATGTWYHLVAWNDSAANTIGIAVNATTPDTTTYTGAVDATTTPFRVGTGSGAVVLANFFDGRIDEVGFWRQVLTSQQRTDLYNGGAAFPYPFTPSPPPAAPVAGWGVVFPVQNTAKSDMIAF